MEESKESLKDTMQILSNMFRDVHTRRFQIEILATALIYLKENSSNTIEDALYYSECEWIK